MKPILSLALLALAAAGGLYLLSRGAKDAEVDSSAAVAPTGDSGRDARGASEALAGGPTDPIEISDGPVEGADAMGAEEASRVAFDELAANLSFEPDPDRELKVSVNLPDGHPAGEPAEVWVFYGADSESAVQELIRLGQSLARVAERASAENYARVDWQPGTLDLPVPVGATTALVAPVGRFIVPATRAIDLQRWEKSALVTMGPKLGACVEISLQLPEDAESVHRRVEHFGIVLAPNADGNALSRRRYWPGGKSWAVPDKDLTATLRGLDERVKWGLAVNSRQFIEPEPREPDLSAGQVTPVTLGLEWGGSLVVDVKNEDGEAVEGARVEVDSIEARGQPDQRTQRFMEHTDEHGRATLHGLASQQFTITARMSGYASVHSTFSVEGRRQARLQLELPSGLSVAGRVVLPSGDPAPRAMVDLTHRRTRSSEMGGSTMSGTRAMASDEEGRFKLGGFEEGSILGPIGAEWSTDDPELAAQLEVEPGRLYVGRLDEVSTDEELVLRLEPSLTLSGIILDSEGQRFTGGFFISAWPVGSEQWGADAVSASFGDVAAQAHGHPASAPGVGANSTEEQKQEGSGDGKFSLQGVHAGTWVVRVASTGYRESQVLDVVVPQARELVLTLHGAAAVTGVVVDPDGRPVSGAHVSLRESDSPMNLSVYDNALSDENGEFSLIHTETRVFVAAEHLDWAPSEMVPVDESSREPITLKLRHGATIRGIVYDEDGVPWPNRMVIASNMPGGPMMSVRTSDTPQREPAMTDESGRFELLHVEPGKTTVSAAPTPEEIERRAAEATGDRELVYIEIMGEMISERVEVADGEVLEIVLGAEPKSPVTIVGRVSRGGEGVAAMVMVLAEEGPPLAGAKAAQADGDGAFEVIVDRPGTYLFYIQDPDMGSEGETYGVTIPETDRHSLELELTTSTVSGVVVDESGKGLSGIELFLIPKDGVNSPLDLFGGSSMRTEAEGAFIYPAVKPGRYSLHANVTAETAGNADPRYGHRIEDNVVVGEDEAVKGLVLLLPSGSVLEGTVRDTSGQPVAGVDVFVRDASGRSLSFLSNARTDGEGNYRVEGLSAGEVSVFARLGSDVTREAPPVSVGGSTPARCDLELSSGAWLVLVPKLDDEPVRIRTSVVDEAGRNWSGLWSESNLADWMSEGTSLEEVRIGPLPGGRYTVIATSLDGRAEAKKTVTVREGQDERTVRLRLR